LARKCSGYRPFENIYQNFPFQLFELDSENISFSFENGNFHSNVCRKNNYLLFVEAKNVNTPCINLEHNQYLSNILKRAQQCEKFTKNSYMTYLQLKNEIDQKNDQINSLKLNQLNMRRSYIVLQNKQTDFKRFVILLSQNDIPRLNNLLNVCLKSNFGINGILNKLKMAMDGVYHPKKFEKDEFDLAVLTLRIGGPRLLNAFNKQNLLPSSSYVYKALKNDINIFFSYECSLKHMIQTNIQYFFQNCTGFFSLKLDEISINSRIRWSQDTNEMIGLCYNHKAFVKNYQFETWLSLNEVIAQLSSQKIHLAKEALFISICKVSNTPNIPYPIAIIPICSAR
jgi:hypothetical protein